MRQKDALLSSAGGHRAQQRIHIERAPRGVLAGRAIARQRVASTAAQFAAHALDEQSEAHASLIFEAAALDRIDGDAESGRRSEYQPGDLTQGFGRVRRVGGQIEPRQRLKRRAGGSGRREQALQFLFRATGQPGNAGIFLAVESAAQRCAGLGGQIQSIEDRRHQRRCTEIDR